MVVKAQIRCLARTTVQSPGDTVEELREIEEGLMRALGLRE
jgi:hypothetical protein